MGTIPRGELRGRVVKASTALVQYGMGATGYFRAEKYRKVSVPLANAVFRVYQIPEEAAASVGEPLGNTLVEYLPEQWLVAGLQGVDPLQGCLSLFLLIQQAMEQEKELVAAFSQRAVEGPPATDPMQNGHREPTDPAGVLNNPPTLDIDPQDKPGWNPPSA